jgi:glycosyltransferase involved in cell wall biosynthesis
MNPKISVLLPVYNGGKFLKESIDSVLSQSYKDFELLIIDDDSKDNTEEIIKSYTDARIKYFKKAHTGLIGSLNLGLEKANGEFIARQDADDISDITRLEKQIDLFNKDPELILIGSYATKIDEFGEQAGELNYPPLDWEGIKKYSILHNPFIHPTVMFKKDIIKKVGGYKNFKHIEDYELWTRVIYKYKAANIPEPLLKYRVHTGQVTKKNNLTMRLNGVCVRVLALTRFLFK